jgi:ribosome-associated toxin RatA of RatAB toxin-antitoxin module
MAAVTREVVVAVPPARLYEVIAAYERYPEFVPGVKGCTVKARSAGGVDVEYELDLGVKKIRYVLRHVEQPPGRNTWSLVSGEWMKISNGSWELSAEGGGTRARYTVEIQIAKPALVPQALVDRISDELTKVQLPRTLEAFKTRAEAAAPRSA